MPIKACQIRGYFAVFPSSPTCAVASLALAVSRLICVLHLPTAHRLLEFIDLAALCLGLIGAQAAVRRLAPLHPVAIVLGTCAVALATSTLSSELTMLGVRLAGLGVAP